ncbi:MAG: enoyl-CoA hydratase/isomerase family protein [Chloroflexi bacterium]|nr:enoyl-CoA hydratase/isomerase family protein [Chloroflexota bacterium]
MPYETLLYEKHDRIGYVTLNRPERLNAINFQMRDDLLGVCAEVAADPDVWVLIVTGAGDRAFCAGADIREGEFGMSQIEARNRRVNNQFHSAISNLDRPVIAAINGFALGGGLEIALACDVRIASEKAEVGLPEVTLGRIPGAGGTQRLPRLVGAGIALEMIMTGKRISAQEAYRIGLVNQVVPPDKLMSAAEEMANTILLRAPLAVRCAKESVHRGLSMTLEQGLVHETSLSVLLLNTEDRREGEAAFREKRPPRFQAR